MAVGGGGGRALGPAGLPGRVVCRSRRAAGVGSPAGSRRPGPLRVPRPPSLGPDGIRVGGPFGGRGIRTVTRPAYWARPVRGGDPLLRVRVCACASRCVRLPVLCPSLIAGHYARSSCIVTPLVPVPLMCMWARVRSRSRARWSI